jgi:hypothetical protein
MHIVDAERAEHEQEVEAVRGAVLAVVAPAELVHPCTRTMVSLSVMTQLPRMSAAAGLRMVMARYGQCAAPGRATQGS